MDNNESSGFKMSIDDKSPDSELQEEIDDLRISKLSQRITLVTILIPTLIGILLLVAYLDMKKKVDKTFNAEAKQVQNLSQNLESKFSSLSLQFAKLEDTFATKILSLEKEIGVLKDNVNKNKKSGDKTDSSKASKKALSTAVSKVDRTFESINRDLEKVSNEIRSLDKAIKGKLAGLAEIIDNQKMITEKNQEDISTISSGMVDRAAFDLALEKEKKNYQQKLNLLTRHLESKISSIQKKFGELDKLKTRPEKEAELRSKSTGSSSPSATPKSQPSSAGTQPDKTALPKPGTIVEQDIQ